MSEEKVVVAAWIIVCAGLVAGIMFLLGIILALWKFILFA